MEAKFYWNETLRIIYENVFNFNNFGQFPHKRCDARIYEKLEITISSETWNGNVWKDFTNKENLFVFLVLCILSAFIEKLRVKNKFNYERSEKIESIFICYYLVFVYFILFFWQKKKFNLFLVRVFSVCVLFWFVIFFFCFHSHFFSF